MTKTSKVQPNARGKRPHGRIATSFEPGTATDLEGRAAPDRPTGDAAGDRTGVSYQAPAPRTRIAEPEGGCSNETSPPLDDYVTDQWVGEAAERNQLPQGSDSGTWTSIRTPDGRFPPGVSGNPAGRPPGSLNRLTLRMRELMEGEGLAIVYKLLEKALSGDMQALRLVLPRIYPRQRERVVFLPLPEIHTAEDTSAALSAVLVAIGDGRITPGEGQTLVGIIEAQRRILGTTDSKRHDEKLETAEAKERNK